MWTIQLLGGLTAQSDQRRVTRFRTHKAGGLLAYLAFYQHKPPHPREILADLFWPNADPETGRHNLSAELSPLRRLLEPPGVPPGAVLQTDRFTVRLNPALLITDVHRFEQAAEQAQRNDLSSSERRVMLMQAAALYQGPLLPGYYEEWIGLEAARLSSRYQHVLLSAVPLLLETGASEQALNIANHALAVDALSEAAVGAVLEVLTARGQPAQALRVYREFVLRLKQELEEEPSEALLSQVSRLGLKSSQPISLPVLSRVLPVEAASASAAHEGRPVKRPEVPAFQPSETTAMPAGCLQGKEFGLLTTTRFFGREAEIARLSEMLTTPRTRLVTLTGPGGIGKTRLALEVAAHLVGMSQDDAPLSTVFVSLAEVTETGRLFEGILHAMGVTPSAGEDPLVRLTTVLLSHPRLLLILDNFEQLAETSVQQVQDLLAQAVEVKLLVTSRQNLRIEGEHEFRLAPLPTSNGAQSVEKLQSIPGIALFVDRAQTVLPDFQLTEQNAAVISQLCDRLEGIPLAIELAAARVSLLSAAHILQQVNVNRLDFLATRRRDVSRRQRTLRSTLDWSYQLLPPSGRQFLRQSSVCRGGWTLEASEAIGALNPEATLELLMLLRDSSLVRVVDTEDGLRFMMLETVREYALEQLERSGERAVVCRRHRDFFLALAEEAEAHLTGSDQELWLARLEAEHDNLRAALEWRSTAGKREEEREERGAERPEARHAEIDDPTSQNAEANLRLAGALWRFWEMRGYFNEGRAYLSEALGQAGAAGRTSTRAKALYGTGTLAFLQGDFDTARPLIEQCLAIFREVGDRLGVADSLYRMGDVTDAQGDYGIAKRHYEESMAMYQEMGDKMGVANSLQHLGRSADEQGDYELAAALHGQSLAIRRELGDTLGFVNSLHHLGLAASRQGDYEKAKRFFEESLGIRRGLGDRQGIGWTFYELGTLAYYQGDYGVAKEHYQESLAGFRELGDKMGIAWSLHQLGSVGVAQGDYEPAKGLFQESLAIWQASKHKRYIAWSFHQLGTVARKQGDAVEADKLYKESLAIQWELRNQQGVARLLEAYAPLFIQVLPARVARMLGAAEGLRQAIGSPLPPIERAEYERSLAEVREALGMEALEAEWAAGRAMTPEQAVMYALEPGA